MAFSIHRLNRDKSACTDDGKMHFYYDFSPSEFRIFLRLRFEILTLTFANASFCESEYFSDVVCFDVDRNQQKNQAANFQHLSLTILKDELHISFGFLFFAFLICNCDSSLQVTLKVLTSKILLFFFCDFSLVFHWSRFFPCSQPSKFQFKILCENVANRKHHIRS